MRPPLLFSFLVGLSGACACALGADIPHKAPFRLWYNNDTTNMESCGAPFHEKGAKFTPDVLYATIDEAVHAGADAYALAPGLTYVPLWQSQVYPPKGHFEWFRATFPDAQKTGFGDYMLAGGDLVADFVAHCRKVGVDPFISLRLNDYHLVEFLDTPAGKVPPSVSEIAIDRFRREHPQWRLKKVDSPYKRINPARDYNVMNFAEPQVRERFLAFVKEICAYDIDGLEIDFMRHFRLFNLDETTPQQREAIVTAFIKQVRAMLDASAKPGQHRWLAVRIPAYDITFPALGINIPAFAAAGVDIFNVSANYYTLQQGADYARLRAEAPDKAFLWEMTHVTVVGPDPKKTHNDSSNYRRTTEEQFYTTAGLAYAAGYDGVSLFNFQYYRDYENQTDASKGPFHEPPFAILSTLKDPATVARAPQHYFMAPVWQTPYGNHPALPAKMEGPGKPITLVFHVVAPTGGWTKDGVFRIQTSAPLPSDVALTATLDGQPLKPTETIAEPYPTPYPQMLGDKTILRAWVVPQASLHTGDLVFTLTSTQPCAAKIDFADLAAR